MKLATHDKVVPRRVFPYLFHYVLETFVVVCVYSLRTHDDIAFRPSPRALRHTADAVDDPSTVVNLAAAHPRERTDSFTKVTNSYSRQVIWCIPK